MKHCQFSFIQFLTNPLTTCYAKSKPIPPPMYKPRRHIDVDQAALYLRMVRQVDSHNATILEPGYLKDVMQSKHFLKTKTSKVFEGNE